MEEQSTLEELEQSTLEELEKTLKSLDETWESLEETYDSLEEITEALEEERRRRCPGWRDEIWAKLDRLYLEEIRVLDAGDPVEAAIKAKKRKVEEEKKGREEKKSFILESSIQICEEIGEVLSEERLDREVLVEEKQGGEVPFVERSDGEAPRSKDGRQQGGQVGHLRCHLAKVNNVHLERAGDTRHSFDSFVWCTVYILVVALGSWNFFEKWLQPKKVRMKMDSLHFL